MTFSIDMDEFRDAVHEARISGFGIVDIDRHIAKRLTNAFNLPIADRKAGLESAVPVAVDTPSAPTDFPTDTAPTGGLDEIQARLDVSAILKSSNLPPSKVADLMKWVLITHYSEELAVAMAETIVGKVQGIYEGEDWRE